MAAAAVVRLESKDPPQPFGARGSFGYNAVTSTGYTPHGSSPSTRACES